MLRLSTQISNEDISNEVSRGSVGYKKRKQVEDLPKIVEMKCAQRREARRKLLEDPSCVGKKIIYSKLNSEVKMLLKKHEDVRIEDSISGKGTLRLQLVLNIPHGC